MPHVTAYGGGDISGISAIPGVVQAGEHRVGAVDLVFRSVTAIIRSARIDGMRQTRINLGYAQGESRLVGIDQGGSDSLARVQGNKGRNREGPGIGDRRSATVSPDELSGFGSRA